MSDQAETEPATEASGSRRRLGLTVLPIVSFAILAAIFYFALQSGDPSKLPSALIGRPIPEFELPAIDGLRTVDKLVPGLTSKDLANGEVSIVNVWASWCPPCVAEHPHLVRLGQISKAPLNGINYKDAPAGARRFLGRYGNPFQRVGADPRGRTAIDFGVYGVPETFIIDTTGHIVHKHVGPITEADIADTLIPAIKKARKKRPLAQKTPKE